MVLISNLPVSGAESALQLRPQQQRMVDAIGAAWDVGQPIAVEAPTGTGKTYAYLLAALARHERFVVSTATRALQDQLVDKDIPALLAYAGQQRKVAVLKGRENYVCLLGLANARQQTTPPAEAHSLAHIERWAQSTPSGDLAELDDVRELPRLLPRITASHSECIGQRCTHFERCFSNRARAKAAQADILVINHHLFFSELRHRQMLGASHGFVPLAATVVMDEAHQLQAIGLKVLAKGLNVADVHDYLQAVARHTRQHARGFAPWDALQAASLQALERWLHAAQRDAAAVDDVPTAAPLLVALHNRLSALIAAVQSVAGGAAVLEQLAQQGEGLLASLRQWAQPAAAGTVRWWEQSGLSKTAFSDEGASKPDARAWRQGFRESPLWLWQAVAALRPDVRTATWLTTAEGGAPTVARWLFTSATLGGDDALTWFAQGMGLQTASDDEPQGLVALRLPSAFDWAHNAALVVPHGLPGSDAPVDERAQLLAEWLTPHIVALGGRCLVLCTSNSAMQTVAAALRQGLHSQGIGVLVQGEQPKRHLLAAMRGAAGQALGHVLVGTLALWEGVDLPGAALQLLVIDKLPFPPRHDALHLARSTALEAAGLDGFERYTLPHTAMQLRQGVGRLIRSATDTGVVVIADERLRSRSYGAPLLAALPPMPMLDEDALPARLQALRAVTE